MRCLPNSGELPGPLNVAGSLTGQILIRWRLVGARNPIIFVTTSNATCCDLPFFSVNPIPESKRC
jgi:hypothetical protein